MLADLPGSGREMMFRIFLTLSCAMLVNLPALAKGNMFSTYFDSLYSSSKIFDQAIDHATRVDLSGRTISGITVPHHLVVANLIASAFETVSHSDYEKVILLSPDHFKRSHKPFATTTTNFQTVFGTLKTRREDVELLLKEETLVEASDLFTREHGIAAILPFIRHYLPKADVVPITVGIGSSRSQMDQIVAILSPLVTKRTLIVQSTDFSHYLPHHEAILHDQQVLNILSAADNDQIMGLVQPRHIDSRGAQYIQMRLQRMLFGAEAEVLFNSNSQDFSDVFEAETTSYIVQIYATESRPATSQPVPGARRFCFVGDFFTGRFVARLRKREFAFREMVASMKSTLNGCPLIVNLEGVLVSKVMTRTPLMTLAMPADSTLDLMKDLNVIAVSVANNHSKDMGEVAYQNMVDLLRAAGIVVLEQGNISDLGPFRVIALNDIDNESETPNNRITDEILSQVARSTARPPLIAFVHWGVEYDTRAGERERELTARLRKAAVWGIVGAHPHVASERPEAIAGGDTMLVFSLGNFLFDQKKENVSGALLEMRFFEQGTFFSRMIQLPNFYRDALSTMQ